MHAIEGPSRALQPRPGLPFVLHERGTTGPSYPKAAAPNGESGGAIHISRAAEQRRPWAAWLFLHPAHLAPPIYAPPPDMAGSSQDIPRLTAPSALILNLIRRRRFSPAHPRDSAVRLSGALLDTYT
ncbi:hypothetical protein EJ04DRAFT_298689 [Polyplosphaeria fusca]|uniref:Uncharacterized protein n=1 Tax=Polyplosphaeria fusca TaxID=682080 RepID=A0A9P4QXF4_9PLEO|nr:hypothetical protein EJ04DRAFT_298689 [Polyplosphaeria fusca]